MGLWIDVKGLRQSRGWLQREAAQKLGCSRVYLSAVENNRRGISMNMMQAIIKVFGVNYKDFHTGSVYDDETRASDADTGRKPG